ncbi:chromate transporter [Nocardia sp. CDC160]|uniref:chromate transporter n=1 Tax=Nocardia sp. CDC160 TaxID=3112166 RepID=UPI002DC0639C|nr:chromate transporter [Nocardia sp. CDC160]MEC3914658.1 chromate transporter [Nocardia sp. CDC160]
MVDSARPSPAPRPVPLWTIAREWGRIGCLGFGGPPAHIALLRRLCVERRGWIAADDFEDGIAATNLLPGPASTQLAIFTAWRLRGRAGALIGGFCFIAPGLALILILAAVFLATDSPSWVRGAAAGRAGCSPRPWLSRPRSGSCWSGPDISIGCGPMGGCRRSSRVPDRP